MYFATIVDRSTTSTVLDAHKKVTWTDRARAPLVKITSCCFLEILDQIHVTHCSVQLPILDLGLLLKCDDIVQDSYLCCFGSWVRRISDVVANALGQECLLGAACPRVGWRAVSSVCDGLTSGSHWDLTPASHSAASSSSKPQSCQGSSFYGASADGLQCCDSLSLSLSFPLHDYDTRGHTRSMQHTIECFSRIHSERVASRQFFKTAQGGLKGVARRFDKGPWIQ